MKIISSYGVELRKQNIPIRQTLDVYRAAVSYLTEVYAQVWEELERIPETKKRFNEAEHLIHTTKKNQARFDFDIRFPKMPSYLRRASIQNALGSVSSYKTRLGLWEKTDRLEGKPRLVYEELIYKKNQELARLFNRIYAVNQKIIDAYEPVKNRVACVSNMGNLPCGIIYMDFPLNRQNYLVQKFYQELFNKYVNNPGKYILLGLVPASNGRVLKIESLDDNERKYAQILDEYLRICFMDEQIEELINCIKMIQFNYISKDE